MTTRSPDVSLALHVAKASDCEPGSAAARCDVRELEPRCDCDLKPCLNAQGQVRAAAGRPANADESGAGRRTGRGRRAPAIKSSSGTVQKNIEVEINRRFKRQGRGWHPVRAERLLQLKRLPAEPQRWSEWWKSRPQFHLKPNPPQSPPTGS